MAQIKAELIEKFVVLKFTIALNTIQILMNKKRNNFMGNGKYV